MKDLMDIKLYTTEEVAEFLGVTVRTVYRYVESGQLKGKKIGGRWLFTIENIEKFVQG